MLRIAFAEMAVCGALWLGLFVIRHFRGPTRKPAVTEPVARWGMLLQFLSYAIVVSYFGPVNRTGPRIAIAMVALPFAPLLAWLGLRHLGKQWRINAGLYADHELVRTGPYRLVRHPIYLSMFCFLIAEAALLSSGLTFALGLALFIGGTEIRVRTEERLLAGRFGADFDAYRRRVPAYVPFLR